MRLAWLVVAVLVPVAASAESLGEAAKRERERREKNKKDGRVVREIGHDQVRTVKEAAPRDSTKRSNPPVAGLVRDVVDAAAPAPASEGADAAKDRSAKDGSPQESEWRSRVRMARARLASAEHAARAANDIPNFNPLDGRQEGLQRQKDAHAAREKAAAEVEAARKAVTDLEEEARRAGVPPGWLR